MVEWALQTEAVVRAEFTASWAFWACQCSKGKIGEGNASGAKVNSVPCLNRRGTKGGKVAGAGLCMACDETVAGGVVAAWGSSGRDVMRVGG